MIEFFEDLRNIGLTALFNPAFLVLLLLLFFLGRLVGWMIRSVNIWKFLALGYFGIFLFRPLQDAGLVLGGIFILGVASMYTDLFRSIFNWSGNLGDMFSAFRHRGAYEDIRRLEEEVEELKRQLRKVQRGTSSGSRGGSSQQQKWRDQSKARKSKSKDGDGSDGRGSDGSSSRNRSSQSSKTQSSGQSRPHRGKSGKRRAQSGSKDGSRQHRARSSQSGSKAQSQTSGQSSQQNTSSSAGANRSRSQSSGAGSSQSQGTGQQSSSQQNQNQNTGQSQRAGSKPIPPHVRDKHLQTLELTPGTSYSEKDIKSAWRKVAFKNHPDRGGDPAVFRAAYAAYQALIAA